MIGLPSNQVGGQEPGSAEQIAEFCSATYGVTFSMSDKIEVKGDGRHNVYRALVEKPDATGESGDVQWNFEKFPVAPDGSVVGRYRPGTQPDAPEIRADIESLLR